MNKILAFILCLPLLFTACDIHEWPIVEEVVPVQLTVKYGILNLKWTEWDYSEENADDDNQHMGDSYVQEFMEGRLRYTIRVFSQSDKRSVNYDEFKEFVFYKDVSESSDLSEMLYLTPGEYDVLVWVDYMKKDIDDAYYQIDSFSEIKLNGGTIGNNDWHDAYRGIGHVTLQADVFEGEPVVISIDMQRPLAKFELIANDVKQFLGKENVKASSERNRGATGDSQETVSLEDYKVIFHYVGYRPVAYSIHADRPVDAVTGTFFESTLRQLNDNEASLGFDYIFVNGTESAVTVQIGLYNKEGVLLSMSDPIKIPLKRNFHTKVYGTFLMSNASGGVNIHPDYDGDHNLIIP